MSVARQRCVLAVEDHFAAQEGRARTVCQVPVQMWPVVQDAVGQHPMSDQYEVEIRDCTKLPAASFGRMPPEMH